MALRRRTAGKRDGVMPGETVPYVICVRLDKQEQQEQPGGQQEGQQGEAKPGASEVKAEPEGQQAAAGPADGSAPATQQQPKGGKKAAAGHLAERAYHPDELREDPTLAVDIEYYMAQQVHPVVARLCAPIEVSMAGLRVWNGW